MEFFTTAVTAIAAIIGKKALEKTGERLGTAVNDKIEGFLTTLNQQSPQVSTAIQKAPETPLDYPKTVAELELALKTHPALLAEVKELLAVIDQEPIPNLNQILLEISEALKSQSNQSDIYQNQIEKVVNLAQGNATVNIDNQTINL